VGSIGLEIAAKHGDIEVKGNLGWIGSVVTGRLFQCERRKSLTRAADETCR
jgi:hypothetical protein